MLGVYPLGERCHATYATLCWLRRGKLLRLRVYSCLELIDLNGVTGICNVKDTGRDGNDKKRNNLQFQDKSIVAHVMIYINCV
jgi:hypothetical protein